MQTDSPDAKIHQRQPMAAGVAPPTPKAGKWVEVFYDGKCSLCAAEIKTLKWLDRRGRIQFTDIAADDFDPAFYGKSMPEFMNEIQGRRPDGSWIIGVEVFRQLYGAIGLKFAMPVTRLPGISHALDLGYRLFAKNRLRLTGRCTPESCQIPS